MSLTFTSTQDILVKSPSDTKICLLKDVLLLSDDRLLLSDSSNGTMKIVDLKTSSLTSEVNVPGVPWGMCHIPEDMVALSVTHSIQFLETRGKLILRKNIKSGEVQEIDMEGKVLKVLKTFLKASRDNASLIERTAGVQFQYPIILAKVSKNPELIAPTGITAVDNRLIICGWESNNILPSGQTSQIMDNKQWIVSPRCVCYSQKQKKVYLTVCTGWNTETYAKVYDSTRMFDKIY
ncbi:hypothetical protein MAR_018553 [Mya arenaria]|uniref:Uncharacterized protein n=1 Tax=Mya arenaria TaxID=6604 RepID=A0ABY7EFE9_MYAAR|nr:hypothetical protein MAR_018553 [Mya arenaria]